MILKLVLEESDKVTLFRGNFLHERNNGEGSQRAVKELCLSKSVLRHPKAYQKISKQLGLKFQDHVMFTFL